MILRYLLPLALLGSIATSQTTDPARLKTTAQPKPRVLAFFSEHVESDHVDFARQANTFFAAEARAENFEWVPTTDWNDLNEANLRHATVVVWLNDEPPTPAQRLTFERYMEHGGGWLGFHVSAYNDLSSGWPWFVQFLGGAVFYGNNWPPLPADVIVEDATSPVTRGLPPTFRSPANEWYLWKPNPRNNKDVRVLLSLKQSNYPLGLKDVILAGDLPIVWTNTRYRMLYLNMGHGDKIFSDATQNQLLRQSIRFLLPHTP